MENIWLDSVVRAHREFFDGPADIIWDIGTRDGDDAEFLREHLGTDPSGVYAVDANPPAIWKTRQAYPYFNTIKTAVSDHEGITEFVQIAGDKNAQGTSSMDIGKAKQGWAVGQTTILAIPVTRMDSLLEEYGLTDRQLDVVKVDVESYTWEVLQGFGSQLGNVKVFHLETEREYDREGHRNNFEVAAFMREQGFHLYDVSYEWGQGIQDQVWINKALATKKIMMPEASEK